MTNNTIPTKMKFIDLFCGIGGFHQALKSMDHECLMASDKDKKCRESYKRNYDIEPNEDVYKIDEKTMGDLLDYWRHRVKSGRRFLRR